MPPRLPPVLTEPIDVEVRGEVLLTTAQFEEANRIRLAHEATPSRTRAVERPAPCGPRTAPTGSS
ncbi:hypothetical protein ABT237_39630 [Streptomyces sp. NPDC001581]|uniref:hypothetical protein n=1 Tax=Streptomyces sp. NPDC001581 TaxID=3154386 RepID=UPI003326DD18